MKRFVIAAVLISMGAVAEEAAKVEEGAKVEEAEKAQVCTFKEWPTLDKLWNETPSGNELQKAIAGGTPELEILLGYEYSDLDQNGTKAANAFITRTRLDYLTGQFHGFDAFIQAQYVGPINDHYRYPGGGNPSYDVVADPENFRFHQAYLAYTGYDSVGRLGPQEINLDNQRFIGNVGWRFNAQSFNAGSVKNNSITDLTLYYAYADSINTILGETERDRQYHMVNAEYKLNENNKAAGFAYLQRNDDDNPNKLDTYGARAWGRNDKVSHEAMIALQRDAYYGSLFADVALAPVNVGAGFEYISGGNEGKDRFQTLNGTAHKFNGWADQFLGTGSGLEAGLVDIYGQVSAVVLENLKLMGVYHYFNTADETDGGFKGEYGQEIDLLAKYPVCKNFDVLAKLAYYVKGKNHPDNETSDETVFWLRATLRF
jgi:hypothetical protein